MRAVRPTPDRARAPAPDAPARVRPPRRRLRAALAAGVALLALLASLALAAVVLTRWRAREAEATHPPAGRVVTVDGVRLHVVELGSGPPVVLLHGNPGTTEDLLPLARALAPAHRVLLVDRPGHGHSARGGLARATPARQAELLHALLSAIAAHRPVLVGHSWGGALALAYADRYPREVEGLVLVATRAVPSPGPPDPLYAALRSPALGAALRHTVAPFGAGGALERRLRSAYAPAPVDTAHLARARRLWLRPGQLGATVWDTELLARALPALVGRYPRLDVPAVLLVGAHDAMRHETERLHDALPADTMLVVAGAGHYLPQTHPGLVAEAVARLLGRPRAVEGTGGAGAPSARR